MSVRTSGFNGNVPPLQKWKCAPTGKQSTHVPLRYAVQYFLLFFADISLDGDAIKWGMHIMGFLAAVA